MNSNCDTFIKQEFLTAEEQQIRSVPDTDLISVKNEPILDEAFSSVTVKNESLAESTCLIEAVPIKTENSSQNHEVILRSRDSFVIYELDTLPSTSAQPQFSSSAPQFNIKNTTQAPMTLNCETSLISNFNKRNLSSLLPNNGTATKQTKSSPVLLNAKLRKRHKIILPLLPIDKRNRYNIEGATTALLVKNNNATISSETAKTCRLLNPGRKQIFKHLIKQTQKNSEEYNIRRNTKVENADKIEQPTTRLAQTLLNKNFPITNEILNIPKQSADSPIMPELRVKCLCSLTDDTSENNFDLREFFKNMFEETRRLNKAQQRKVKMTLLKAICDAEDLVEQGKCCGF